MNSELLVLLSRSIWSLNIFLEDLKHIKSKHFSDGYVSIFTDESTMQESMLFEGVIREISYDVPTVVFDCSKSVTLDSHPYIPKPKSSILYMGESSTNSCIESLRESSLYNNRAKILVLVENNNYIEDWLQVLWNRTRASNVTVVSVHGSINYSTWYPYQENQCDKVREIIKLPKENLFSIQLEKNIHSCPFKAVQAEIVPFNILPHDGVETLILDSIVVELNASLGIILFDAFRFWAQLNALRRPGGALLLVHEHLVDVAAGALQQRYEYIRFAEIVIFHTEDSLGWFVPIPAFIPSVQKFQRAIPGKAWLYLVGFMFIGLISSLAANIISVSGHLETSDVMVRLAALFLYAPTKMPSSRSLKYLFIFVLVFSLHVTTMYQSALIYILSNKVAEKPIKSVQEAIDRNLRFYFYEIHRHLINVSDNPYWIQLQKKKQFQIDFIVPTKTFCYQRSGAFLGPVLPTPHYLLKDHLVDEEDRLMFEILEEKLMTVPTSFITSPGHPMFRFISDITQHLLEGGFPKKWLSNYQKEKKIKLSRENKPLDLESLTGAFQLLLMLLAAALTIFVGEVAWLLCTKCVKRTNKNAPKSKQHSLPLKKKRLFPSLAFQ